MPMPVIAIHYIIFIGIKDGKMNFCLFYNELPAVALYAPSIMLLAYGGAVLAMTLAVLVRAARPEGLPAVNTVNTGDTRDANNGGSAPGVSVVIPFRNEERNLNALLAPIDKQDYAGTIEVVLVNDGSTDGGADIINKFTPDSKNININMIDLRPSINTNAGANVDTVVGTNTRLTSKQRALDTGVDKSSHRLILFTDADMILEPAWVRSMVNSHLSTGADMVFGHTAITREGINTASGGTGGLIDGLFALLESYQLEYLFSFACAFSRLNLMGSCMGNNILVTKEAYTACGGQRGVGYTIVEDRALLGLMRKRGFKTSAQEPFAVTAWTYPSRSKKQFANQALRWAAGGLRPGGGLFIAGLLLLTQNVLFLLSTVCALPPPLILQSAVNFVLTWAFLSVSFHKNGSPVSKILFPAYYIFMMAETALFLPVMLFKGRIEWKGRKV
jgi:cellulose synthase/poly-beta-1,6-N-acetylglucosamine synthase-like glycosyltransferase